MRIRDGGGKRRFLSLSGENAAEVVVHPHPPRNVENQAQVRPFQSDFADASGTTDMRVGASLGSPETFSVLAPEGRDAWVKSVAIVIADGTATLSQFGAITALANGCKIVWEFDGEGEVVLAGALQSNFDFVQFCGGNPAFGDAAGAFRANNVVGNSEAYIPVLDFATQFGMPFGIKLRAGSTDRLSIVVQDDTTGVDAFYAIAYGSQLNPET